MCLEQTIWVSPYMLTILISLILTTTIYSIILAILQMKKLKVGERISWGHAAMSAVSI